MTSPLVGSAEGAGSARLRLPPAVPGPPLIGNFLQYRKDHLAVFERGYALFGPVFSLRLGPQRAAVLVGPKYHEFFFSHVDGLLSVPELYRFTVPMFGEVLNAVEDQTVRLSQLAMLRAAFSQRQAETHYEKIALETEAWIDDLGGEGEFEIYEAFSRHVMNIAAALVAGDALRGRMDEISELFDDLARGMDFVLPPDLPLPRFRRRDRARRRLFDILGPIVAGRRHFKQNDMLQTIIDGDFLTGDLSRADATIAMTLVSVFTGYLTTSAQLCWVLVQLLQNPAYLARVTAEIDDVAADGGDLTYDRIKNLPLLDRAIKESLRMFPVMSHYARFTRNAYVIDGYDIPAGWLTMLCPALAHRLPGQFANPDLYDPDRFGPGREEDRRDRYALIPFGGGTYTCPGAAVGVTEMTCVAASLLRRFRMELVEPEVGRDFDMGIVRPKPPCMVRYRRRHARAGTWNGAGAAFDATGPACRSG